MRSRYKVLEQTAPHFITTTVVEWLPVFTSSTYCDVLIESLNFCREHKGLKLYAFVIMDNHIHLLAYSDDLPRLMKEFKSYTAYRLIQCFENSDNQRLLKDLAYFKRRDKSESNHQFWQEGYHPQAVTTDEMMLQKMEYLHFNPVRRGLVDKPEHWRYSSATSYYGGGIPVLEIDRIDE